MRKKDTSGAIIEVLEYIMEGAIEEADDDEEEDAEEEEEDVAIPRPTSLSKSRDI